jgi:MFS family permease
VASLLGGLFLGHIPVGPWALARRMVVVLLGSVLAAAAILIWTGTPAEFWTLSGALLVAGLCIAPALAVMFAVVSSSVRFSDTAEAYGWVGTGQLIGAAAGSAVAGFLIDYVSESHGGGAGLGGFIVAVVFASVGTLVPVLFHARFPDLRGRDASPLPDTEPVPLQPS